MPFCTQENGDKRYYRRSLRLQEVQDEGGRRPAGLRENIGCGTAATKDWGYLSGKLLPHGAYGIGNYTPLPGSPTEGGNTLESMATYTGFYAHRGGFNNQGYGYGMPTELVDGEDYAVIAVKASQTPNRVFGLVWADDGLWFDTLDQGMAGRKKWARVFSDRHPPSASNVGALRLQLTNLSVDLNTMGAQTDAGLYQQQLTANATTANHYPINEAGSLLVSPSAYGCQQEYTSYSSRRKFIRGLTSNWTGSGPWSEWAEMYGPSNNPAPDDVNCIQRDGCHIGGFASGDAARPYMRHTASNVAVELAKVGDSYTKTESDARYGGGKTTTGTNNAYYTHANGVVFMQAVRSIVVGNNSTVTVTLPTSFPNGILGVGASFYGTGGQDQDSYYLCTPVGKNQVTINTHNCNGTFSLIVSGY
ncbi:pyocin knob domain-containing protein [Enterobacter sp. JMULE2]|uniref:pyocin knob domain-containing protein n=1 Tax=Enterobacter sp. JMULE2 TaxID=2518340 RepID=UPI001574F73A|nr:pyocin knob domain-containing protein [Enterobacter sp. JMULE2]